MTALHNLAKNIIEKKVKEGETFAEPAKYCHFRGAEKKMNSAEVQKIMGGDKH